MASRRRDYAAEYRARQVRARDLGFESYWQQRQTRAFVKSHDLDGNSEREFTRLVKHPRPGLSSADVQRLWAEGNRAIRRGDYQEAERIARRLGYRDSPKGPPQRVFWYH